MYTCDSVYLSIHSDKGVFPYFVAWYTQVSLNSDEYTGLDFGSSNTMVVGDREAKSAQGPLVATFTSAFIFQSVRL